MSIDVVYAKGSEIVGMSDGVGIPVVKGTHWPAGDPVVRARPGLFSPDPRFGLAYSPSSPPPGYDADLNELEPGDGRDSTDGAEQATAAPGERRSVRRRS